MFETLLASGVAAASVLCQPQPGATQPPPERPERIEAANPDAPAPADPHAAGAKQTRVLPGLQPDGQVLLPNQWSLRPVGPQIELGDFPVNIALHPSQNFAAILHAGHGSHEIVIVDTKARSIVSRVVVPQAFYGVSFNKAGTRLYASGCEQNIVHSYAFGDGYLSDHKSIAVADAKTPFVVTGITPSPDDSSLYVCGSWGNKLAIVPTAEPAKAVTIDFGDDSYPYLAIPDSTLQPDVQRLFVSLWGGSAVAVVDTHTNKVIAKWPTPSHPTEMVLSPDFLTLYVSCANSTQVVSFDTETGNKREIINCALYPAAPSGSTPNSLALSADGHTLAVANADNNNLAIFNVDSPGKARSMGFVPTGWYPTSVRFLPDGTIIYASGKGLTSKPNRAGPNPLVAAPGGVREYIGGLFRGSLGFVRPFKQNDLATYTKNAYRASPLDPDAAPRAKLRSPDNPIPAKIGDESPIKHCIYIIKENRTYDQILGDMPQGNGDPSLCIFPERITPNHHAIAREFVLLDNFYVESEVSADGHEWSMGAYATDFVEKTWPLTYRSWRPDRRVLAYPAEGSYNIAIPAGGYIWDRCKEAGVSYRSYGEWVESGPGVKPKAKSPALEGHFDEKYQTYDLEYPDVKRAQRFLEELREFEAKGDMPALCIIRLPNDHTMGARKGKPTPTAFVAENDQGLGTLLEGVSKSKFWATTAIFVVEDDAQNGSDHVDAHRTIAFVASPYCKRGAVDSSMYSTSSMLRTIELILGLQPMSQFDAAALPMYNSFTATPDFTPYTRREPPPQINDKNLASAWGAELSETFDFAVEDAADDLLLNEVVWRSVRGPDSPMPPPVRAAFVFAKADEDD